MSDLCCTTKEQEEGQPAPVKKRKPENGNKVIAKKKIKVPKGEHQSEEERCFQDLSFSDQVNFILDDLERVVEAY